MKVYLLPYMMIDGAPTFKDSSLMYMYDKIVNDGTVKDLFFDGSVKSHEEFAAMMKRSGIQLYEIHLQDKIPPVGFVWLDTFSQKTARGHFCIYKEHWGGAYTILHEVLVYLLSVKCRKGTPVLDAIYGFIPETNTQAIETVKRAGMIVAGTLPYAFYYESDKKSHPGVMMYYTRDEISEEELI